MRIWEEQDLNAFFRKIKNGMLPDASPSDKEYLEKAKKIRELDCCGPFRDSLGMFPFERKFEPIPPEICVLENLEELDLSYCHIKELPPEIARLKKLKSLKLRSNEFRTLPKEIVNLENLVILDLGRNSNIVLPEEFEKLQSLKYLNLEEIGLEEFPLAVCHLRNLKELNISSNKIKHIPAEIVNLQNLKTLNVSHCELTSIHRNVGRLKKLSELSYDRNYLLFVQKELMDKEKRLWLDENPRSQRKYKKPNSWKSNYDAQDHIPIPRPDKDGIITLNHPTSAQTLLNLLTSYPRFSEQILLHTKRTNGTEFFDGVHLPKLQHFKCCSNLFGRTKKMYSLKFTSEEQAIRFQIELVLNESYKKQMVPVQILDMEGLYLQELSPAIVHLPNLERIFLQDNQLYKLPDEIGSLEKLTILNLANNALETLPQSLENLVELRSIILDGNPLDGPRPLPHFENLPEMEIISTGCKETDIRFLEQCHGVAPQTRLYTLLGSKFLEEVQAQ
ncbi:leucine-rich repeat domain-containing protein [bacterium]|nr:leucine-rich repeat domain-containing protein [bacterium]